MKNHVWSLYYCLWRFSIKPKVPFSNQWCVLCFQMQSFLTLIYLCLRFSGITLFILHFITKTCLYNFDPLKPHFYTVKLGFTGVYIIFVISAQKHILWVLVRTASARRFYRVPTIYVLSRNMKNIRFFYVKNCHFWVVKFSVYLNRRVFVMSIWNTQNISFNSLLERSSLALYAARYKQPCCITYHCMLTVLI